MKAPFLDQSDDFPWHNWHRTDGVGGVVERMYTPQNSWKDGSREPAPRPWLPGLAGLSEIVRQAERDQKRVRAVGSGWSLSGCAFTNEYLVNTARLTNWSIGLKSLSHLQPAFQAKNDHLVFAQCGVQIKTLNNHLEARRLALPTAGASNGQTIVGAMSTGTHGSANTVGGVQDFVLGLHVVAEGGKHFWLERMTRPVVTKDFLDLLDAELIQSDDLFHAALVSFGSFGLIHAVLFQVEPVYLLDRFVRQCDFSEVENAIATLDMNGLGLPKSELPYHFEIVLNPYKLGAGQRGAFIRTLYRRDADDPLPIADASTGHKIRSEDLVGIAAFFSNNDPTVIPGILQGQLEDSVESTDGALICGTPGQQFNDSSPTGGGTSLEIGVALSRAREATQVILDVAAASPFGAPLALRYVKSSEALLAFTCHSPITCTLELPGIDSSRSRDAHQQIFEAMKSSGIPHTYHWGQALPLHASWLRPGFGDERVDRWLAARRSFLSDAGLRMFANDQLSKCGLDT